MPPPASREGEGGDGEWEGEGEGEGEGEMGRGGGERRRGGGGEGGMDEEGKIVSNKSTRALLEASLWPYNDSLQWSLH